MAVTTISKLSTAVVDNLFIEYPSLFGVASKSVYVNAFQAAASAIIGTDIALDTTTPDYERVMMTLIQELSKNNEWRDLITAGSGQALLRMISSGIAFDQYSIERAFQEAFISSASSENSIYAATRMLGVRPRRKLPAAVQVTFTRQDVATYYEIPAISKFTINNVDYFSREKIGFKSSQTSVNATLYQGLVVTEVVTSDGEPFQEFVFGDGSRSVADADVHITINSVEWEIVQNGPWTLGLSEFKYYETTRANGDVGVEFGNGDYGAIPTVNTKITITWVKTLGKDGNVTANGLVVKWTDMPTGILISGVTTTPSSGGDDEISPFEYRKTAPNLRAANSRAVRRSDYKDLAIQFSGVRDALFRGQAELAPGRRSMMNVIGVTLLTDTLFTATEFSKFDTEFKENLGIYQCEFLRIDPTPVDVSIKATVYCRAEANLNDVKATLTKGIEALFAYRRGYLGYNIYRTDITDVLNGRITDSPNESLEQQVEYVVLDTPTTDTVLVDHTYYARLISVDLTLAYTTRGGFGGRLDLAPQQ